MNWQEYVGLAIRTESVPINEFFAITDIGRPYHEQEETNSRATRLLHAALGVCTETAELRDGHTIVNWVEEIGDILWYLAIADDVISWHEEHYHADLSKPILFYIGEVQDVLKRHIFYGAKVNVERLGRAFSAILGHCAEELVSKSFKLEEACKANIMKLEKRYPDKFFDAKAAIHRDVDRELEHIGGDGKLLMLDTKAIENVEYKEQLIEVQITGEEGLTAEFIADTLIPLTTQQWNELVKTLLTPAQIEKLAMDLAFEMADKYRVMGALSIARAYDAMYASYSGRGDKLEDISLAIMWNELGYAKSSQGIKEQLERWK